MTVITWAEFPKIEDSKRGQESAVILAEMFLPSSYADKKLLSRLDTQKILKIAAITGTMWFAHETLAFAESLDVKARTLYYDKFVKVALWIIAAKGGWDSVHKALKEDFEGAKRAFLQYLLVFAVIMALPKALQYVEILFLKP